MSVTRGNTESKPENIAGNWISSPTYTQKFISFSIAGSSGASFEFSQKSKCLFLNELFKFLLLKYFQIVLKRKKNIFALQWEFLKISPPPLKIEQDGGGADIIGYHHPFYFAASLSWQKVVCSRTFSSKDFLLPRVIFLI